MRRSRDFLLLGASTAAICSLSTISAHASGYAVREQSAAGQGSAFAGMTAGDGGLSAMFFNPAALGLAKTAGAEQDVAIILPKAEVTSASGSTILGTPIPGQDHQSDAYPNIAAPAVYGAYPLSADWTVRLAVNAPFGLGSKYDDDWTGRYHAIKSKLFTVNATPTLAWRPAPWLMLGGGFSTQYIHADLSNAIDFGTIGAARQARTGAALPIAPVPAGQDGKAEVEGDDIGFGVVLGAMVEPAKGTRLGLSYRSQVSHELDGDADFDLGTSGMGAIVSAATGQFVDTGVQASLTTPTMVSFGASQEVGERLNLLADVQWTDWSQFDQLRIEFDNPAQQASVTQENWKDTWFASVGAAYRLNDQWTLRTGVAYDETPVPDADRTPRIPDGDRYWISAGASWSPSPSWTFDVGYSHLFIEDVDVDLSATGTGNTFRGNLQASYESSIDIFALAARFRF